MHGTSEPDVELDPKVARTREAGGVPADHPADPAEGDAPATTGTGVNDEFVGRVAGQDLGYAGTTGAEARADAAAADAAAADDGSVSDGAANDGEENR
jgi:hypothetical protein